MEDTDKSRLGDYLYIIYPNELETKNITHNHKWFGFRIVLILTLPD